MTHSENMGILTPEQWGGRSGKQCVDLAMNVELLLTILHLSRSNASMMDADASAFFDCIAPALLYLAYSKAGTSRNTTNLLGKALLRSRYYPTTSHGVLDTYNSHSKLSPFCGSGEGSCDGTPSWVQTCNPCLLTYKDNAKGMKIEDPTGKLTADGTIGAFVDDIKLFHHSPSNSNMKLLQNTEWDSQQWSNSLWGSGGALNFLKPIPFQSLGNSTNTATHFYLRTTPSPQ